MKRLLSLLGVLTLGGTLGASVVACAKSPSPPKNDNALEEVANSIYGVATSHFGVRQEMFDPSVEIFQSHLRGFINPILKKILNKDIKNINGQYTIEGITEARIQEAIERVGKDQSKVVFKDVLIKATNNATDLVGEKTFKTVGIVKGRNINTIYDGNNEEILIKSDSLVPLEEDILSFFKSHLKDDVVKEIETELKLGHFKVGNLGKNVLRITGQGQLFDSLDVLFEWNKALPLEQAIKVTELGELDFNEAPSPEEIANLLKTKNGGDEFPLLKGQDWDFVGPLGSKGVEIQGYGKYKGTLNLTWTQKQTMLNLGEAQNTSLGLFSHQPSLEEILAKFNNLNPVFKVTLEDVSVQFERDYRVILQALPNSKRLTGSVTLEWTNGQPLIEKINLAKQLLESDQINEPSEELRAGLELAIQEAQSLLEDSSVTNPQIQGAVQKLEQSMSDFIEGCRTDFTRLSAKVKEAKDQLVNHPNPNGDAAKLQVAINRAQLVLDNPQASQIQVNAEINALTLALDEYNSAPPTDFTKLQAKVEEAQDRLLNHPNPDVKATAKLQAAVDRAQQVLDNPQASQIQVDGELQSLSAAIKEYDSSFPADFTELEAKIEEALKLFWDNRSINPPGSNRFYTTIEEAKRILKNPKASQETVDRATMSVEKAMQEFRDSWVVGPKLIELIVKLGDVGKVRRENPGGSPETYQKVSQLLNEGDYLYDKPSVTIDEIDDFLVRIDEALQEYLDSIPTTSFWIPD